MSGLIGQYGPGPVPSAPVITIVTASAGGSNQVTATAISATNSIITSVGSGQGVILSGLIPQTVFNRGANTLNVYPPSGAQIESLTANAAFAIAVGSQVTFYFTSSSQAYALYSGYQ